MEHAADIRMLLANDVLLLIVDAWPGNAHHSCATAWTDKLNRSAERDDNYTGVDGAHRKMSL